MCVCVASLESVPEGQVCTSTHQERCPAIVSILVAATFSVCKCDSVGGH